MIHVRDLTKSYADLRRGQFVALAGVSFDARPGEIYGLLGPNGAGKTSVLRILSTVLRPTSGTATVNGYDVLTQPALVRQQIGFVSANTAVYDRMTAWEMVEYFGRLYGLAARAAARADGSDLHAAADERNSRRAGGQDVHRHEAEGLDRPGHRPRSAGADLRRSDRRARRARGPGAAARRSPSCATRASASSFRTHIMREAERLCDRVAILHRGHILAEGTLAELRERHGEQDLEELFFQLISRARQSEREFECQFSFKLTFVASTL